MPTEKREEREALMLCGMNPVNAEKFWHELLACYLGTRDEILIKELNNRALAYMLLRLALMPALKTEFVE